MRLLCFLILCCASLVAAPVQAEQAAATQKAPQTQPVVPQAYQLDIRNVLNYQVVITTRAGTAAPTTTKYREMVIFDIDGDGNLVVYIGSPEVKAATTPAGPPMGMTVGRGSEKRPAGPGEHRQAVTPGERKPAPASAERKTNGPEEAEKVAQVWTRHVLGKGFTQGPDGTVSFRPAAGEVMPYPVLPLPPATLKEKERFELTVPDLALGQGKTLQVTAQAKVGQDGKLIVDCRMDPKIVPGTMPELAVLGYDIPASAAAVSGIRMTRRPAMEPVAAPGAQETPDARPRGERSQPGRAATPPAAPMTSVLMQLVGTRTVPDEMRKSLIAKISDNLHSGSETPAGEKAADQPAAGDKPAEDASGKPGRVTGNLWEQVEQLGTQSKERGESSAK